MVGDPVVSGQLSGTSGRRRNCVLLRNRRTKARRQRGAITPLCLVLARLGLKESPQFRRDMEKPKAMEMVRARSSTGNSPVLTQGLD